MGSYNMAFNKILFVLVAAGGSSARAQSSLFGFSNNFNNAPAPATPSTTPVPILRYVDNQNIDGSYTYGYEAADGTYKLERRFVDGRVQGKYGYYDPEGVLREASYGAEAGRGFEPEISGLELPPPVTSNTQDAALNEIPDVAPVQQKQFSNFQPNNNNNNRVKVVNGRRALIKKVRRVKATPAPKQFIDEQATKQANLKARQEQLRTLEEHRRQLLEVQRQQQQQQSGGRQQQARAFSSFPSRQQQNTEQFRSAAPAPSVQGVQASDPFISGPVDLSSGSYSYS